MTNVICFPTRPFIRIDGGTVTESSQPDLVGRYRFFVGYVDEDGYELVVWDGADHLAALAAAKEWRLPIVDKTRGAA